MQRLSLNEEIIEVVKNDVAVRVGDIVRANLIEIILYGSCARGDYTADSDIDIAILTRCSQEENQRYIDALASLATDLAIKYFAIVNFVCIPFNEYLEKKSWYAYYSNIDQEGERLFINEELVEPIRDQLLPCFE